MREGEDTQDFDIWAAEWVVAPFVGLGLEEEKGRVGRGGGRKGEGEGVNLLPFVTFDF